jgi:hypothetical protein
MTAETAVNKTSDNFSERMKMLGKGELAALRRAFGSSLSEADGNALAAFYKICPKDVAKEEAAYLSACAVAYISHYGAGNRKFAECLKASGVSESRVKALLGNKFIDQDGFFHAKYSRLVRFSVSKGFLPDVTEIYTSLNNWYTYRTTIIKQFFTENEK